jgi:hypothetical protein
MNNKTFHELIRIQSLAKCSWGNIYWKHVLYNVALSTLTTYIPFLACQECQPNQQKNKNDHMKEPAVEIFKNSEKDLAR